MTERQLKLFEVARLVSRLNLKYDMDFEIFPYNDGFALKMTGKVEGRSIKLPFDWKFSKKNGGTIVGPDFFFMYHKNWKYKMHLI